MDGPTLHFPIFLANFDHGQYSLTHIVLSEKNDKFLSKEQLASTALYFLKL